MDILEIKDIAESLKRRLELLREAGITGIPKQRGLKGVVQGGCPSDWAVFSGTLAEAVSFTPCQHDGWKGVLFGIWPLGKAAVVWGVPVSAATLCDGPFGRESLLQLERMLNWLAGELKAEAPCSSDAHAVLAARCPQAGSYSDTAAAEASVNTIEGLLQGSKAMLLMGGLAACLLLRSADLAEARGRVHKDKGRSVVVTFSPEELLRDQVLKKGAHADLKLLIPALEG